MTAGLEQLERLGDISLDKVVQEAVAEHEPEITELNKEQLDKGLDSDGNDLGKYSSVKYKGRLRPVDLLKTGAFRSSFGIDPITGGFVVTATDSKTERLQEKYGEQILGIAQTDYDKVGALILDDVVDKLRQEV